MQVSVLGNVVFALAFSPLTTLGIFIAGFIFGKTRIVVATPLILLLGIVPILLVILSAWISGCWQPNAQCMTGFGVILAFAPGIMWVIAAVAGMGVRHLVGRRSR